MLLCFGTNGCGQFGAPTATTTKLTGERADCRHVSARILLPKDLSGRVPIAVSASPTCTALVTEKGECLCLGLSPLHTTENFGRKIVAPISKHIKFRLVACGHDHILALSEQGELWGWGNNSCQQLGPTSAVKVMRPTDLRHMVPRKLVDIAAGKRHSIALGDDGVAYSWGNNEYGQLGIGAKQVSIQTHVVADPDISACASSKHPVAAAQTDSALKPSLERKAAAHRVVVDVPVVSVAAGWEHSAFITKTGVILTCGFGMYVCINLSFSTSFHVDVNGYINQQR